MSTNKAEFNPKNFRRFGKLYLNLYVFIVENPLLRPRKDYDDYT